MSLTIIPRSAWGARPPRNGLTPASWPAGVTLWVHHTEGATLPEHADPPVPGPKWTSAAAKARRRIALASLTRLKAAERAAMRAIQDFHQNGRGWNDVGYAVVGFPSGRVYEGRGLHVVGAHCPGHNSEPSFSMAGSYVTKRPSKKLTAAVHAFRAFVHAGHMRPHCAGFSTDCPGNGGRAAFGWDQGDCQ